MTAARNGVARAWFRLKPKILAVRRRILALLGREVLGEVEHVGGGGVSGWAIRAPWRRQIKVRLFIDDVLVEEIVASGVRTDIAHRYGGAGKHGFRFAIGPRWRDGVSHRVVVTAGERNIVLSKGRGVAEDVLLGVPRADIASFGARVNRAIGSGRWWKGQLHRENMPIVLFACHSGNGVITRSQRNLLEGFRLAGLRTIICQSSLKNAEGFVEQVSPLCSDVLVRADSGRDFASWCIMLDWFEKEVRESSFVVLANDSFFVVSPDLSPIFDFYEGCSADIFGITESLQQVPHLQSSFLVLSKSAVMAEALWKFVRTYPFPVEREHVITNGELALTSDLVSAGLRAQAMLPIAKAVERWIVQRGVLEAKQLTEFDKRTLCAIQEGLNVNSQHIFWRQLLCELSVPFIKRELMVHNPVNVPDICDVERLVESKFGKRALSDLRFDLGAVSPRIESTGIPSAT